MNTSALVSRADASGLPQWSGGSYSGGEGRGQRSHQGARFLSVVRKYWWLALLIWLAIGPLATVVILRSVKPAFIATGAIRVAPTRGNLLTNADAANAQMPFYTEFLRTQAELIKSSRCLQRAAEDPRLKAYGWFRDLTDQVDYLAEHVEVVQVPSSQLITLSVTHENAHAASDLVNSVIDAYTRMITEDEENSTGKSLQVLKQFRDHTEGFLKDSQERLYRYQADGTTLSLDDDKKVVLDLIAASRTTMAKLEGDQTMFQATLESLKNRPAADKQTFQDTIVIEGDGQIEKWTAEKIRVQMADNILESRHATGEHPDRVEFHKQIKALDAKIAARTQELKDSHWREYLATASLEKARRIAELNGDLAGVRTQIAGLQTRIDDQDSKMKTANSTLQPIATLREQIAEAKDSLKHYNDRIQELESQNVAPGRVNVGWAAAVPVTPKVDKRVRYTAAANGGAMFLGMMTLVMLSRLRNRIEHPDDLPENLQPLVVGTVSHADPGSKGLQGRMRRKILGEEMRLVHANLLPPGRQQRRVMMVTSPTPANGKTSIAAHLALSLAKSGLEVLLIDADLRKRDLTDMFDIGMRPGLAELLQGGAPEYVRPVELLPNLRVMGAGAKLDKNPVELFQRKHMRESIDTLVEKFDCIIVDTPPTLVVADARMIAPSCDEVLCVVRAQVSSEKDLQDTLDAISRVTGETPKIIVNGVEHRQKYYKYKFSYTDSEHPHAESGAGKTGPLGEGFE